MSMQLPSLRADSPPNQSEAGESTPQPELTYEDLLNRDPRWALSEGSRHFDEQSSVFASLNRIAQRLHDLNISYAIVGGMALFKFGLRRFTEDVDILVTKSDLKLIHQRLGGLGYVQPHAKSKHLRDTENRVRIEFLTTGSFPGDGKEKPVAFPDPRDVAVESNGLYYVNLPTLIEMKLASGMTAEGRRKDLADVQELIKILNLSPMFSDQLHPYVRDTYLKLCSESRMRYVMTWRNKWLTSDAKTLPEMISKLHESADHLQKMFDDGVFLDQGDSTRDDYAMLVTTDPKIAEKYGMIEESEYWDEDLDESE